MSWQDDYDAMWSGASATENPINVSLDDLNAIDTDSYGDYYDSYDDYFDTSPLDDLFSGTAESSLGRPWWEVASDNQAPGSSSTTKKDDRNFLEKMFGGVGSVLGLGGGSGGGGGSGVNPLQALLGLGLASYGKDRGFFDPKVPVVGYQGKVPKYQAIQEQVTGRDDSDRRPGSSGRRYMSDVTYAAAPENQEPMSVAEAQARAKAQVQGFAEGGDVAAFLQGLGGGEGGGGGYENLIRSMQPQGRAAPQRIQTAPAQPAPMPMPAPSGGTGGMDMLALAALLQGQQGGGAQPQQVQPQQALPSGVAPGGKYYDFNGTPMYQPPMPTAAPGQFIAQVMPNPIDLTTGKPQDNSIGGGIADAMKKMQEQAPKQMPTTDRVAGPPKGQRRRGQPVPSTGGGMKKSDVPVGRGTTKPAPSIEELLGRGGVKKGNVPVGRGVNDGAQYKDTPPRKAQPAPRRAPTPPMDYSKMLNSIGGVGMAEGGYLNGDSDGQADKIPGSIDGVQEARLSHGEYVLPADLVSLLGNGNSDAGAKALDEFMAMVRKKGTGTEKQQNNIKADKVLASLMKGKG